MHCVLIKKMFDGTQTEEYLHCTYKKADDRFYDQLFETMPMRIELWKLNRKGERCKMLNVCAAKDNDHEAQMLFEQATWSPKIDLGDGIKFRSGGKVRL